MSSEENQSTRPGNPEKTVWFKVLDRDSQTFSGTAEA